MIPLAGSAESFFAFLRERYHVLLRRRAGQPAPWTDDPILQAWRFCNVRREDDKVTVWFRENIRDPLRNHPSVFFSTIAFRWFNTIETGEALRPWLLGPWNRDEVQRTLETILGRGGHIFTGAFMINSAPGKPKHIDVLDNLDWVASWLENNAWGNFVTSKQRCFESLLNVPRLGNFAAYQIVVDLQYTYLLEKAPDLQTFTVAGPGCAKGIGLCFGDDPKLFSYGTKADQKVMLEIMRDVLDIAEDPSMWPEEWPKFMLSDIENGFCEYAKWRSGHAGERLKRKYTCKS